MRFKKLYKDIRNDRVVRKVSIFINAFQKKLMERRLFRIIIGLLALSLSCSKDNNSSSPSVTFLANGTPYSMVPAKLYAGYPGNLRLACGDKNSDSIILLIWVP
ncbi:MAG TPA: hypothetical protein VHQ04_07050, partial [Puia sp.]|nr:hypothetical protein [Puia sp.]